VGEVNEEVDSDKLIEKFFQELRSFVRELKKCRRCDSFFFEYNIEKEYGRKERRPHGTVGVLTAVKYRCPECGAIIKVDDEPEKS